MSAELDEIEATREKNKALYNLKFKRFLEEAFAAGDAGKIIDGLFMMAVSPDLTGTTLSEFCEAVKNLSPVSDAQTLDAIETDLLRSVRGRANELKEKPLAFASPRQITDFIDSNRRIVENVHQALVAIGEVKKDNVQPLTKAYLEETASLSPSNSLYVTELYEAALSAVNKIAAMPDTDKAVEAGIKWAQRELKDHPPAKASKSKESLMDAYNAEGGLIPRLKALESKPGSTLRFEFNMSARGVLEIHTNIPVDSFYGELYIKADSKGKITAYGDEPSLVDPWWNGEDSSRVDEIFIAHKDDVSNVIKFVAKKAALAGRIKMPKAR